MSDLQVAIIDIHNGEIRIRAENEVRVGTLIENPLNIGTARFSNIRLRTTLSHALPFIIIIDVYIKNQYILMNVGVPELAYFGSVANFADTSSHHNT